VSNPTFSGATFYLVDPVPGQQSSTFSLPANRWVEVNGSEIDFPVLGVAPLGQVGGVLQVDQTRICFLFPGNTGQVKKDSPTKGIYVAVKADPPSSCPNVS
jgi:hypothetical protein